jgi:hypothetical protein
MMNRKGVTSYIPQICPFKMFPFYVFVINHQMSLTMRNFSAFQYIVPIFHQLLHQDMSFISCFGRQLICYLVLGSKYNISVWMVHNPTEICLSSWYLILILASGVKNMCSCVSLWWTGKGWLAISHKYARLKCSHSMYLSSIIKYLLQWETFPLLLPLFGFKVQYISMDGAQSNRDLFKLLIPDFCSLAPVTCGFKNIYCYDVSYNEKLFRFSIYYCEFF